MGKYPANAVRRVEFLRDGASAQYGTDAIAGVVNIVLKNDENNSDLNFFSGITAEGDGYNLGFDSHMGFRLDDRGFFNLSFGSRYQDRTNRAGTPGRDNLFGVGPDNEWIQDNPDLGMIVGQPIMLSNHIFYNMEYHLTDDRQYKFYSYGGVTYRDGESYALYRTPYWVPE